MNLNTLINIIYGYIPKCASGVTKGHSLCGLIKLPPRVMFNSMGYNPQAANT